MIRKTIRRALKDTLIGIILLAILGFAAELIGTEGVYLCSAACALGFLTREVWERRRREVADRRIRAIMNRNRARLGIPPLAPSTIIVRESESERIIRERHERATIDHFSATTDRIGR